jgi:5-methylcytosine-specific restriction endonuclease McrA
MRYEIKNGKNKTYYFKNELKEFGCQFKKTGKYSGYWYLNTDDQFLANRLQAYCLKKGLTFLILESSYSRNAHYRADFFANNKPIIKNGKPYYRCVYCGRLFQKNQITIDHLYPIHKVKNSSFRNINRELLKKFDIEDINDCKNLVAACSSCNKRKSKKTGLWLIRGYLGKYPLFWKIAYYVLILSLCLGILIMLFN